MARWKWKLISCVWLFVTPWIIQSMKFSRPEYWSGLPFPSPGDLPNPGIKPRSPTLQADSLPAEPPGKPKNIGVASLSLLQGIFPTQESNWGLLYCRQILYQLSYQGAGGNTTDISPCVSELSEQPFSNSCINSTNVYWTSAAAAAAKSLQSCPTLCDPIDGSPPGSAIPGILQARTLEWVAISFSSAWKWKVKVKLLSRVWLFVTPLKDCF